ncbi:MAG: hypothetical protein R2729_18945 [Bryobacteraceae bacterium]
MTLYQAVFLAWVAVTVGLAAVAIYRAVVGLHEDDQLFLDPAEDGFRLEQKEVARSIRGLDTTVLWLTWCSGGLFALIVALGAFRALGS